LALGACRARPAAPEPSNALADPTATPTQVVASGAQKVEQAQLSPDHYCLECHSDKQRLIETAKVEEEKKPESKGEG
jgi:hypothetical protein